MTYELTETRRKGLYRLRCGRDELGTMRFREALDLAQRDAEACGGLSLLIVHSCHDSPRKISLRRGAA